MQKWNIVEKAGCVVSNDQDQLLLVRATGKRKWQFPKGHVEIGESIETAAARETLEETGCRVEMRGQIAAIRYTTSSGHHVRLTLFHANLTQATNVPQFRSQWFERKA